MTPPWGAICYAVAAGCAAVVAHRRPEHAPIRDTLLAAAVHALLVSPFVAQWHPIEPRHALALWLLVPATAGRAYAAAFGVPVIGRAWGGVSCALAAVALWAPEPAWWWRTVTWAPLCVAALLGGIASSIDIDRAKVRARSIGGVRVLQWEKRPLSFTQRIAWALIASDVFTLLCEWLWPAVQPIQGKAAAIGIAVLHLSEFKSGTRPPS